MPLWKRFLFALAIAGVMTASLPGSAGATNGHWQPPDLEPTQATADEVRALYERGTGAPDSADADRIERYDVATANANLESTATIADGDLRARGPRPCAVVLHGPRDVGAERDGCP